MFDEARQAPYHPLMQDPGFAEALRRCAASPVTLPSGLTLLHRRLFGLPLLMLPRAIPPANLIDQLRQIGLHHHPLILSPEQPYSLPRCLRIARPKERIVWDIAGTEAARRNALHAKWRNQLTRAEERRISLTCNKLPADPQHPVLITEHQQSLTKGYRNWPAALTAAFAAACPDQTHLFRAYDEGVPVAHMLFLTHGSSATYHMGHITARGKTLGAHNLLLWRAARRLAARGIQQIDLGLLDPRSPGLNRFKLRTGATRQPTGGTYLFWSPMA